jgi:tripartite-type tricarboxylate transporter receptor subunit TctC
MRLRMWHVAGALFLAAPSAAVAQATQPWPERTIQAIVPFAPGAANDIVGRIVLEQVSKQVGQPIVVENRPGAGGTIGVTAVAKAQPNGYTILVHSSSFSAAYSLYKSLPYDTLNDFARSSRSGRRRRCWSPRRRRASRPSPISSLQPRPSPAR